MGIAGCGPTQMFRQARYVSSPVHEFRPKLCSSFLCSKQRHVTRQELHRLWRPLRHNVFCKHHLLRRLFPQPLIAHGLSSSVHRRRHRSLAVCQADLEKTQAETPKTPPFDLDLAVLLAGFSFESYNTPKEEKGLWEVDVLGTKSVYTQREFLREIYKGRLKVKLKKAVNCPPLDPWGTNDVYVTFKIGETVVRSRTIWTTREPEWNEEFLLFVEDSEKQTLLASAFDANIVISDRRLGVAQAPLQPLADGAWHSLELPLVDEGGGGILLIEVKYEEIEAPKRSPFPLLQELLRGKGLEGLTAGGFLRALMRVEDLRTSDFVAAAMSMLRDGGSEGDGKELPGAGWAADANRGRGARRKNQSTAAALTEDGAVAVVAEEKEEADIVQEDLTQSAAESAMSSETMPPGSGWAAAVNRNRGARGKGEKASANGAKEVSGVLQTKGAEGVERIAAAVAAVTSAAESAVTSAAESASLLAPLYTVKSLAEMVLKETGGAAEARPLVEGTGAAESSQSDVWAEGPSEPAGTMSGRDGADSAKPSLATVTETLKNSLENVTAALPDVPKLPAVDQLLLDWAAESKRRAEALAVAAGFATPEEEAGNSTQTQLAEEPRKDADRQVGIKDVLAKIGSDPGVVKEDTLFGGLTMPWKRGGGEGESGEVENEKSESRGSVLPQEIDRARKEVFRQMEGALGSWALSAAMLVGYKDSAGEGEVPSMVRYSSGEGEEEVRGEREGGEVEGKEGGREEEGEEVAEVEVAGAGSWMEWAFGTSSEEVEELSPEEEEERKQMQARFGHAESAMEAWVMLAQSFGEQSLVKSEFEKVCFLDNERTDTQVVVWRDTRRRRAVFAFRGTEQSRLKDLITDLMVVPAGFNPERIGSDKDDILVHRGFLQAYDSVRPRLFSILKSVVSAKAGTQQQQQQEDGTRPWRVYSTGHSLGGALATLFAVEMSQTRLARSGKILVTMYNFGSPRVGNQAFAQAYNKAVNDSWRVVNHRDIIPTVPRLMGYCHVAQPIYLAGRMLPELVDAELLEDGYHGDVIGEATAEDFLPEIVRGERDLLSRLIRTEIAMLSAIRDGSALMQHMEDFYYIALLKRVELRVGGIRF